MRVDPVEHFHAASLISDADIEVIVVAARTRPEKLGQPFTRWSLRNLAALAAATLFTSSRVHLRRARPDGPPSLLLTTGASGLAPSAPGAVKMS